jgi:hypothetical protein
MDAADVQAVSSRDEGRGQVITRPYQQAGMPGPPSVLPVRGGPGSGQGKAGLLSTSGTLASARLYSPAELESDAISLTPSAMRPWTPQHHSVPRHTMTHHGTQKKRPASAIIRSYRAVSAGGGRCWVRTNVGCRRFDWEAPITSSAVLVPVQSAASDAGRIVLAAGYHSQTRDARDRRSSNSYPGYRAGLQ